MTDQDLADDKVPAVVREVLSTVYDPCCRDKGISVVDMGLLHRAWFEGETARVEILLTSGWCPFASDVLGGIEDAVRSLPGVSQAQVDIVWDEVWTPERLAVEARAKLRFLPDPSSVGDRDSYLALSHPTHSTEETA
jgi:metal-sulfur cluster biosynthetic enzyme